MGTPREVLGQWMADGVQWADAHRRSLLWGGLLGACSGAALLLKLHGLPGYRRITQAELVERLSRLQREAPLLRPQALRLPVLLTAAEVSPRSGLLVVSVQHYPPLLRVADWVRGRGRDTAAIGRDAPLTCNVAGLQGVDASVGPLLAQHLAADPARRHPVQQLRVFAVTTAAAPGSVDAGAADSAPGQGHTSASSSSSQQPKVVWGELWCKGLPASALKAAAEQVPRVGVSTASPSTAAAPGSSSWQLPRVRRRDAAEELLLHGLARLADPEDCEWLGIHAARWRAYERAMERARRRRVGLHADPADSRKAAAAAAAGALIGRLWSRLRSGG